MTTEQERLAKKLARAIDVAISGGILCGADIPQILKDLSEAEADPEEVRAIVADYLG